MKWFAISKYRGGVKVLKFWIVCPLKTLISGRSKHLKNSFKILANTFSDSLAILKKKFAGWRRQIFFHTKIPGSLLVPITLSELWEWEPFRAQSKHKCKRSFVPNIWKSVTFCDISNCHNVTLLNFVTFLGFCHTVCIFFSLLSKTQNVEKT